MVEYIIVLVALMSFTFLVFSAFAVASSSCMSALLSGLCSWHAVRVVAMLISAFCYVEGEAQQFFVVRF